MVPVFVKKMLHLLAVFLFWSHDSFCSPYSMHPDPDSLPVRIKVLEPLMTRPGTETIGNRMMRFQAVSGGGVDNVLNALGLDRSKQRDLLLQNLTDPYVRQCIVNELIYKIKAKQFDEIDQVIKKLIKLSDYNDYMTLIDKPNFQDLVMLSLDQSKGVDESSDRRKIVLETLKREKKEKFFKDLDSDAVLRTYVQQHLQSRYSFFIVPFSQGQLVQNSLCMIDAVGYVNKIGIRIFSYKNKTLFLKEPHGIVPISSQEVAYLFLEGGGIQAMVPSHVLTEWDYSSDDDTLEFSEEVSEKSRALFSSSPPLKESIEPEGGENPWKRPKIH